MNHFVIKTRGDERALLLQSTIDASHFLPSKVDEEVQFGRDDLIILKNKGEAPQKVSIDVRKLDAVDGEEGALIIRSTRQATFVIPADRTGELKLGGGEVLQIRHSHARNPKHNGASLNI